VIEKLVLIGAAVLACLLFCFVREEDLEVPEE
jgi:hypothetical protein